MCEALGLIYSIVHQYVLGINSANRVNCVTGCIFGRQSKRSHGCGGVMVRDSLGGETEAAPIIGYAFVLQ